MWNAIRERMQAFFSLRLIPVAVVFVILFAILVGRMFVLQVAATDTYTAETTTTTQQTRKVKAARGNIYDCNGTLLAYNELSYNVVFTENDKSSNLSTQEKNEMIYRLIRILERQGDSLSVEFYIELDSKGNPQFTVSGSSLLRFKAEVFSTTVEKLDQEKRDMTAQEVFDYLRYDDSANSPRFVIDVRGEETYSDQMALKIMSVRYAMYINRFKSYQSIVLAQGVCDNTVAAIKENNNELPGVDIEEDSIRVYNDSEYFSHILGYTGFVTTEKLAELQEEDPNTDYTTSDQIGISGLESTCEDILCGTKGTEILTINDANSQIVNVERQSDPVAGNDLYLTIDADLQKECYHLLEEHIAGILVSNINNSDSAGSKGSSASDIKVPITDVYSALIENNIINSSRFTDDNASDLEKKTYKTYKSRAKTIKKQMRKILKLDSTTTAQELSDSMAEFIDYFYGILKSDGVILSSQVDTDDAVYKKYTSDKISLSEYLQYAIANSWVDLGVLGVGDEYFSTQEIYQKLIRYGMELLNNDETFTKMVYSELIHDHVITGQDICLLLFDQGDIKYNAEDYRDLQLGMISPYSFIIKKIKNLEITPGDLGLEPCSGSLVVVDVNTGDVKAMVSYPSYDNNKMANQVDSDYFYTYLTQSTASPLINRPVQQEIAPGSTFKIISSVAGLEEGVITTGTEIYDKVKFDKINPSPSCWKTGGHGNLTVSTAIENSCNYFFYSVGFELGYGKSDGTVDDKKGLSRLEKYADMFGLTDTSGVELSESEPQFSDTDIVRSAIGQATHAYTPSQLARYVTTVANGGTCYNLTLVDKAVDVSGEVVLDNQAEVRNTVNIADSTWDAIHEGMYLVTNGQSSSTATLFTDVGTTVAGKTGTAQINSYHANHGEFISYAPYDDPEISVTCVIPNGYASANAAQTARDVYKYYFSSSKKGKKKKVSGKVKMPDSGTYTMD